MADDMTGQEDVEANTQTRPSGKRLSNVRGIVTLVCCFLLEFTAGISYVYGNILPYLTSYLRQHTGESSLDYSEALWVGEASKMALGASMPLLGLIEPQLPPRIFLLIGCCFFIAGLFGSYWAVQRSFVAVIVCFGGLIGVGKGVMYPAAVSLALKWLPHKKGLVTGVVMAGYGGGALLWNQLVSNWINPDNLQAELVLGEDRYFTQEELLSRVPTCMLLLGGVTCGIQLLCIVTVCFPPPPSDAAEQVITSETTLEKGPSSTLDCVLNPSSDQSLRNSSSGNVTITTADEAITVSETEAEDCPNVGENTRITKEEESALSHSDTDKDTTVPHAPEVDFPCALTDVAHNNTKTAGSSGSSHDLEQTIMKPEVSSPSRVHPHNTPAEELPTTSSRGSSQPSSSAMVRHGGGEKTDSNRNNDEENEISQPSDEGGAINYTPLDMLRSRATWTLVLVFFTSELNSTLLINLYKAYGQTFIHDDRFLSIIASCTAVFNSLGRPIWGAVADRFCFQPTLMAGLTIMSTMTATLLVTEQLGRVAFSVWVFAMFSAISGVYSLEPSIVYCLFGPRHFTANLGIVRVALVLSSLLSVFVASAAKAAFGWHGIFLVASSCGLIALLTSASLSLDCGHPLPKHMQQVLFKSGQAKTNGKTSDTKQRK